VQPDQTAPAAPVTPEIQEPEPPKPVPAPKEPAPPKQEEPSDSPSSEQAHPHSMLQEILHMVRSKHRQELYEEFSFFRLVAMVTGILSLFCLIVSLWFWFDSSRPVSSAQMMLGYAVVLQLVTIALLLVKKDR